MPRKKKPSRNELIAKEALEWVGTKFHPQASAKQIGCDCKGLVWGVARELNFPEADSFYATFIDYDIGRKGGVPGPLLREGMAALFDRADEPRPGDVLLLSVKQPCHLAIVSRELNGHLRAVHAQIASRAWVKETRVDALLTKFELDSVWRWRNG